MYSWDCGKLCFISTSSCLPFSAVPQSIRPQTNDCTSLLSFGSPPLNEEAKRLLVLNLLQPILCLHIVNGVRYCSLSCKLLPLAQQWHIHVAGASCTAYKCPEKERALSFLPQRKMPLLRPFFKHHKAINKHSTGYVKPPDLKPTIPTKREHIP